MNAGKSARKLRRGLKAIITLLGGRATAAKGGVERDVGGPISGAYAATGHQDACNMMSAAITMDQGAVHVILTVAMNTSLQRLTI